MSNMDICVLTAGKFDLLEKCLDAISEEVKNTPCNVYVYDNGSPTKERIETKVFTHPVITKHKRGNHNAGFPLGANTAINMSSSPLVLFVSDDIFLHTGALKSLLSIMEDKSIGLCGLKLLFAKGSPSGPAGKVQHIGHSVDLHGNIIHPLMGWSADNPRTCKSGGRFSVTGACFIVRRELFKRVGGFNAVYGKGYFEDVELALNIKRLGGTIRVDCNAVADHWVGATFTDRKENPDLEHNRTIFLARNKQHLAWTDWQVR